MNQGSTHHSWAVLTNGFVATNGQVSDPRTKNDQKSFEKSKTDSEQTILRNPGPSRTRTQYILELQPTRTRTKYIHIFQNTKNSPGPYYIFNFNKFCDHQTFFALTHIIMIYLKTLNFVIFTIFYLNSVNKKSFSRIVQSLYITPYNFYRRNQYYGIRSLHPILLDKHRYFQMVSIRKHHIQYQPGSLQYIFLIR